MTFAKWASAHAPDQLPSDAPASTSRSRQSVQRWKDRDRQPLRACGAASHSARKPAGKAVTLVRTRVCFRGRRSSRTSPALAPLSPRSKWIVKARSPSLPRKRSLPRPGNANYDCCCPDSRPRTTSPVARASSRPIGDVAAFLPTIRARLPLSAEPIRARLPLRPRAHPARVRAVDLSPPTPSRFPAAR